MGENIGSASPARGASWLSAHETAALDDFWVVCTPHLARVNGLADGGAGDGVLRVDGRPEEAPRSGAEGDSSERDWEPWECAFTQYGTQSAADGKSVAAAYARLRTFRSQMAALLFEKFASQSARLFASTQVLNDVLEHGLLQVTNAFLAHNESLARSREEALSTMLDSIGDAVIVTDDQGRIVRMNPIAELLTGYTYAECQGKPLDDVFCIQDEATGKPVESPVRRVLDEGIVVGLANHTVLVARDGTKYPIADSGAPVRRDGGQVSGVVLVFRDVSEERRGQAALQHWERIFQHATWGVAVASASDVRLRAVNPMYAFMHGYTVEELVGAPVSILWSSDTRADMERHAQDTHDHGRLVAETTHVCKDGSLLPVEIIATTIKDADGQVEWFVANVQDISDRQRFQRSRLRAIELESENLRIEEANRLKSEFLASMSHELRTPLNLIIGFAELLHDEQVGSMLPKQREFLQEILDGGRHLLRLINDVLDLAKVEAGKLEFRPEVTELGEVVAMVVHGLRATVRDRNLPIEVSVASDLGEIVIDVGRFKQILYNYLSNALKFTPDGGHVSVRVLSDTSEGFRLEVEDTGIGISEEAAKRLFVAFEQVDSATAKKQTGTGLGLALTKRLAEAQGGAVGMRPGAAGGCLFYAVLPRRPAGYVIADERRDIGGLGSLLVVDADAEHRALLVQILMQAGYRATAVETYDQAIAAWERHPYAALVLDLLEGSAQQDALLKLIHADERHGAVPVVAFSMFSKNSTAPGGFAVSDILSKPVDSKQLLAALERSGVGSLHGRPIVVIDDDPGALKLMSATLAQLGYDCLCFSGARGALLALPQLQPAAIVLDLVMPEMDGLTFLDRFRSTPENRNVPILVWTVKDLSTEERNRLEASVSAIVQKGIQDGFRLGVALQSFLGPQLTQRDSVA